MNLTSEPIVLETLRGFVESIRGDSASVTLRGFDGTEFNGVCEARELQEAGIAEQQPFLCQTVRMPDETIQVRFKKRPVAHRPLNEVETASLTDGLDFLNDDILDSTE
jgi:hypothetical protein